MKFINHGTIIQFIPDTDDDTDFLENRCQSEDWQWMGHTLCVSYREAGVIAEAMVEDGLLEVVS